MYDQSGGYKLLYHTRHHVDQPNVLISLDSDLHLNVL